MSQVNSNMSEVTSCSLVSSSKEDTIAQEAGATIKQDTITQEKAAKEDTITQEEAAKEQIDVDAPHLKVRIKGNQDEVLSMDDHTSKLQTLKYILHGSRFFLVHSASWVNIRYSQDNGVWAASPNTEEKLNAAIDQSPSVIVIACVPQASQYTGFARLVSVSERKTVEWETLEGKKTANTGIFKVEWLNKEKVAFSEVMHLCKALDTSKPIITCNDGEELESLIGLRLCAMLCVNAMMEENKKPILDSQDLRHKISAKNTPQLLDLRTELNFRVDQSNRLKKLLDLEPEISNFKRTYQYRNETSVWHYKKLGSRRNLDRNYDNHLVRYQYNRCIPSLNLTHQSREHMDFEAYVGTHHVRPHKYLEDIQQRYKEEEYRHKHSMKDQYKQSHGLYHHDRSSLASRHFRDASWRNQERFLDHLKRLHGPQYHHSPSSIASDYHNAARYHRERPYPDTHPHKVSDYHGPPYGSLYHQRSSPVAWDFLQIPSDHHEHPPYLRHHQKRSLSPRNPSERSYEWNHSQRSYHTERKRDHSQPNSHTYTERERDHSQSSHTFTERARDHSYAYTERARDHLQPSSHTFTERARDRSQSGKHHKEAYSKRVLTRTDSAAKHDGEYNKWRQYYNRQPLQICHDWRRRAGKEKGAKDQHSFKQDQKYSSSSKYSSDKNYRNAENKSATYHRDNLQGRKKDRERRSVSKKNDREQRVIKKTSHSAKREKEDRYKMYKKLVHKYGKTKADNMYCVHDDSSSSSSSSDSSSNSSSSSCSCSSSSSLPSFDGSKKCDNKKGVDKECIDKKRKRNNDAAASTSCETAVLSHEVEWVETNSNVVKTAACSDSAQPMTEVATYKNVPSETITKTQHTNYLQISITGMTHTNQTSRHQQHSNLILLTK